MNEPTIDQADQQPKALTPILHIVDGEIRVSSLDVAKHFGKLHKNVLRDIRSLEIPEEFRLLNFEPAQHVVDTPTGGLAEYPMIEMSRDGFTLLTMGFTGKKAMLWKIAYIEQFNKMEAKLKSIDPETIIAIIQQQMASAMPALMTSAVDQLVDAKLALDPRVAIGAFTSAREVLDAERVPSKGRRGLVTRASHSLNDFCMRSGKVPLKCARTGTRLFPSEIIPAWLKTTGKLIITTHQAELDSKQMVMDIFGGWARKHHQKGLKGH